MTQAKGFAPLTAQQIYQQHQIYADDVRLIAQTIGLGKEPFAPSAVEAILGFVREAKSHKLTIKQAVKQLSQVDELRPDTATNGSEPAANSPEPGSLPVHLQSLLNEAATRAQAELEQLDQVVYEQVELPAAQAAVDRILAADGNIERLMLKRLSESIAQRPGRLGGVVLQAIGQFRPPTLQGTELRYALPAAERT